MDQKLTSFLTTEYKIGKVRIAPIDLLLLAATVLFGILLRSKLYPVYAPREPGLPSPFGGTIVIMKYVSTLLDYFMSLCGGLVVYELTGSRIRSYLTVTILFLSPAAVTDSALWGFASGAFLGLGFLSLLCLLRQKEAAAAALLGGAALMSPYALFLVPVFTAAFLQRFGGRKRVLMTLSVLFYGAGGAMLHGFLVLQKFIFLPPFTYERILSESRPGLLSYNVPGLFALIGEKSFVKEYTGAGLLWTLTAAVLLGYLSYKLLTSGGRIALEAALLSSMVLAFLMPGAQEQSLLLASALSVVLAMYQPRAYRLSVLQVVIAFLPTAAYFRGESFLPMPGIALLQLLVILVYYNRLYRLEKL